MEESTRPTPYLTLPLPHNGRRESEHPPAVGQKRQPAYGEQGNG
jgi:hypothetical protein